MITNLRKLGGKLVQLLEWATATLRAVARGCYDAAKMLDEVVVAVKEAVEGDE